MIKFLTCMTFAFGVAASPVATAAERTITLAVSNMHCAECPFLVKKSLEAVRGVAKAVVSFKEKTAVVTHDDGKADLRSLTNATGNVGYPSAPKS